MVIAHGAGAWVDYDRMKQMSITLDSVGIYSV
jgi:predicted alpha/beta-hydrolase family hydrolase